MKQLRNKVLTQFLRHSGSPAIELVFVLQDVEDSVNIGAAFRIGDTPLMFAI